MRKTLSLALAATVLAALPATAQAQRWHGPYGGYGYGYGYDRPVHYGEYGNRYRYGDRHGWRGRTHCDRGTGGTIIGAIAGGLIGNAVVGHYGDHTLGTIAGAGLGAVTGRAIDRDC